MDWRVRGKSSGVAGMAIIVVAGIQISILVDIIRVVMDWRVRGESSGVAGMG